MAQLNGHDRESFDELVDAFYDVAVAATEGCAWCNVLPKVCHVFDASAGSFLNHDFSTQEGTLRHEFNIPSEVRDAHDGNGAAIDPWINSLAFYEEGAVVCGEDIPSPGPFARTALNGSSLNATDPFHRLCGVIKRDGQQLYLVNLLRPPKAPAFNHDDKAALSGLLPHLKRSTKVRDRVVRERMAQESLAEFVDFLPVAFLLVGRSGRVELRNRVAKDMIARQDGLFVGAGGYLATASTKNTADLREFIAETADAASNDACVMNGDHFIISRGADRLPLICVMYPVIGSRLNHEQSAEPAVAVLIKDPQIERFDGLPDFAGTYGLTQAETRLIGLLTAGQGLFEAAEELGVTKNTARTHMRNIYSKIGTNRQADLIRLFAQFSMF